MTFTISTLKQFNNISQMGQQLPPTKNQPIAPKPKDMFESSNVQRIKDTPFIDAHLFTARPPIYIDATGPNLQQLVEPRLGTTQLFPQQEVIKLMEGVANGLADLSDAGFTGHGDLCLESIYYSSKDKCFKLVHPIFNDQSGYLLTKHGKRFTTLSPEQLSALSQDSQLDQVSFMSDIFALGIVLCQICTLTPSSDIYCPDTYSIFHLEIQKRVELVQEYYPPRIAEFISLCLHYDPEERGGLPDLLQMTEQMRFQQQQQNGQNGQGGAAGVNVARRQSQQ